MKLKTIMTIAATAAITACSKGGSQLGSGIDLANLDTTYSPGADFYMFATGGWQKNNPLTAEYSRFGSFEVLSENCNKQLREIIDSVAALNNEEGSIEQKIADFYNAAMDSVSLNGDEAAYALQAFLACDGYGSSDEITKEWLANEWPRLNRQGVAGLFSIYIGADEKDAQNNIISIIQGGMTLRQKEYYLDTDEETTRVREAYKGYIESLAQHMGFAEIDALQIMTDVMRIETRIAKVSRSMTELRNPETNYNKMTYAELKAMAPAIEWDAIFKNYFISDVNAIKDVIVGQPEVIAEVNKILQQETPQALQNYYLWHAMDMAAAYVDDQARQLSFNFWGKSLSGTPEDRPRWKRAVASVEDALGEALGQLYVARFFPPEAKERMQKLIANLQVALGERIDVQDWMSDETKKVAHEKLDAFYVKVGYPDKWTDFSTLKIGKVYLTNVLNCNEWSLKDAVAKHFNKPVDHDEWFMNPQTVNAYYNPTTNEICFPAGILQPPFFDMNADDAFNYGAIGVVIGHEMTHGFDDQGAKYDKNGNLNQWWKQEDTDRFNERIQVMRTFHDNIEVLPGLHANGSFTLGENMADHGGLMVAFQAFKNATEKSPLSAIDGFTPEQRFFLAYANVWGQNIRDEEIRRRVKSDPHQLGKWRVNGQLPHIDAWYDAFGITDNDPMFIPKEERVTIW
ncbi:MAG: M13 family metallopeptidase [Bacteroidales bacterium]|nr:M13 family metallopeptidase [Candidatus Physcousia equi]